MRPKLDLDTLVLDGGAHAEGQGMCIMEAAAYVAGEPWSDHPSCVSPVIGAFLRSWNDSLDDAERQDLKQYVPLILNTAADRSVEDRRAWIACDWLVRVYTPAWLRLAGLTDQAGLLASMAELTPDTVPSIRPAIEAVRSDVVAAGDTAGTAAWAAAFAAAGAGDAAWAAARDQPNADAGKVAWAAADTAVRVAARVADGAALQPTVIELQQSAHQLIHRLIKEGS